MQGLPFRMLPWVTYITTSHLYGGTTIKQVTANYVDASATEAAQQRAIMPMVPGRAVRVLVVRRDACTLVAAMARAA